MIELSTDNRNRTVNISLRMNASVVALHFHPSDNVNSNTEMCSVDDLSKIPFLAPCDCISLWIASRLRSTLISFENNFRSLAHSLIVELSQQCYQLNFWVSYYILSCVFFCFSCVRVLSSSSLRQCLSHDCTFSVSLRPCTRPRLIIIVYETSKLVSTRISFSVLLGFTRHCYLNIRSDIALLSVARVCICARLKGEKRKFNVGWTTCNIVDDTGEPRLGRI